MPASSTKTSPVQSKSSLPGTRRYPNLFLTTSLTIIQKNRNPHCRPTTPSQSFKQQNPLHLHRDLLLQILQKPQITSQRSTPTEDYKNSIPLNNLLGLHQQRRLEKLFCRRSPHSRLLPSPARVPLGDTIGKVHFDLGH